MLAITKGRIETVSHGSIPNGTILIGDDGKIKEVGSNVTIPAGCEVIDAAGQYVFPGFIDSHSHIGIFPDGEAQGSADGNELTNPITSGVRIIDAFNTVDVALKDAIRGGITAAWVTPGSGNVIGGQGSTLRLWGEHIDDMILKSPSGMKGAMGENPKRVYGNKNKMPSTRLGVAKVMRQAFFDAQEYARKMEKDPDTKRDLDMDGLLLVLNREIPFRTHAHTADDILTAMRIAREFGVDHIIEHGTEAYKVVDELLRNNIPVSCGPALVARVKVEVRGRSFKTPGILARNGVKVSIITDHPVVPEQYLVVSAALAVREGMEEQDAIRAITQNPADICGVGDRLGSIDPGKDGDVVIWDGHPFEYKSKVAKTIILGKVVYDASQDA
ncbi:amidohydrolase [Sulfobacillus harzensis]|uniref:Amidohydrolase n=1 Tax=Sulfobacillus harzensis TaxID=2729629 RepID=A0A7Y0Q0S5_9FIRM|nr:amidohydrolase [Sulfobacillus harzensis]NMP21348.1 amidohydrolase [Sulfobacillus harzensis]